MARFYLTEPLSLPTRDTKLPNYIQVI
uniref:Uncharacterized protein n=1 Tax=Arundo donax TaxID=35708 RepID=A0A0A9HJT3_ARUDO